MTHDQAVQAGLPQLADVWAGTRGDIRRAIVNAESWDQEWAAFAVYSDGTRRYAGSRSYVKSGPTTTPYRGSSRRMPTRERALAVANAIKAAAETHPFARIRPRVVEVGAELVKTRTPKIGVSE